jgi:hypothetical protein
MELTFLAIQISVFKKKEQNFTKFHPEKYDFNICKGFSMKKMAQIRQISKTNKLLNRQIFQILIISSSRKPRI